MRPLARLLPPVVVVSVVACAPPAAAPHADVTAELQAITQQLDDAIAPGEKAIWDRYLDPGFVVVNEENEVQTRAEFLADLKPLPPGFVGKIHVTQFRAATFDSVTLTTYVIEEDETVFGQMVHGHFRVSDVWRSTPRGFRMIGSQEFALLRDPPRAQLAEATLDAYAGTYELPPSTRARIRRDGDHLVVERDGRPLQVYVPELVDVFFTPGHTRSRRIFQHDASGRIIGFVDRREGEDIAWRRLPEE